MASIFNKQSKGKVAKTQTDPERKMTTSSIQTVEPGLVVASTVQSDMPGLPEYMVEERKRIQKEYDTNTLTLSKWIWWDSSLKSIHRIFVAVVTISSMAVGIVAGIQDLPFLSFVSAGLAGVAALKEPFEKLFITDFTSRRRRRYRNRCRLIKDCLDAMYLSWVDANADGVITPDEIKKYQKLIKEMEQKLFDIDFSNPSHPV